MSERSFQVSVPADTRYLRSVRAFFQPLLDEAFGESLSGMLVLALDEACANIIKHCPEVKAGRRITFQATVNATGAVFRLRDFCGVTDVPNVKPRDLTEVRPGGLGTHFIATIMDSVRFEPEPDEPGRVSLVLVKNAPPREKVDPNEAEIGQTADGPVRTLTVRGDVDMDSSPDLRDVIKQSLKSGGTLRIDLRGVGYIDSSGIAVLIQGHKWARNSQMDFRLVAPSPQVNAVINLSQLQTVFTIEPAG